MSENSGFDPSQHKPDPNKETDGRRLERAGTYLLALTWMSELGENKNGKLNARFKVEVIDGPEEGAFFFDSIYFIPSTYQRLGALCAAMGVTERFDFENTAVRKALLWKPFKSSVKIEASDGKKYAKLGYVKLDVSADEGVVMDQWVLEAAEERRAKGGSSDEWGADPGGPQPPDDDDLAF